jgi:hypothetical protein
MAVAIRIIIAILLIGLLWGGGQTAHLLPQEGLLTWRSLLATSALLLGCLLTLMLALLPALSLYSPENNVRANVKAGSVLAVWNPSKSQVLTYVALAYAATIYLFGVLFLLISNYDQQAFTPNLMGLGTASYPS